MALLPKVRYGGNVRQPEMSSKLQTSMFIGVALVEGLVLFALVICFLQM